MNQIAQIEYPSALPVTGFKTEILNALNHASVIIVCGDTGSGKTTQLPKMAYEWGLQHKRTRIVCTQPRRIAAVTMAERVAREMQTEVGGLVGWQHRFGKQVTNTTRITFKTDGVLLAETRHDPLLRHYDTIIIDEAHERSLNVDFLLGILKRILVQRAHNLKIIISSATLDVVHFSAFFDHAPVISVPGKLFPIEIRYRPPFGELDLPRAVSDALTELPAPDDTLVFLPGERDIRECAEYLTREYPDNDILPLLASLPAEEQRRVFKPSSRRRVVLATNVAETSLTIPGIRHVIDSGLARIARYIHRTQVQRLQIEPISQASAKQRTGRCGRLGPGICIRLYDTADFAQRDAFTPPEILRSSLAGVILTMLDLHLGDIACFPFLDPPKSNMIHEGLRELLELNAITRNEQGEPVLTPIGQKLAQIPIEPRLGRMLIAASERGTLPEALPIIAALSCDNPKRRPIDEHAKADQAHARFRVTGSDFLGTLALWNWWQNETRTLSQAKARALAKKTYLSYPKMRQWRDLVLQLEQMCHRLNLSFASAPHLDKDRKSPVPRPNLHRALLTGLLGHIGKYDTEQKDYRGTHGTRLQIHPGSVLARKNKQREKGTSPPWIVASELLETTRLFACQGAEIDSNWLEEVAGSLCKKHCHTPVWDEATGFVRATEQVTLYGLVIVEGRPCDFSRYDPALARRIFIENGLVDGRFLRPPAEVQANTQLLNVLRRLADKQRNPEIFPTERLIEHFEKILPSHISNGNALRKWLRTIDTEKRERFLLKKKDWWPQTTAQSRDFPESVIIGNIRFPLTYKHTPDNPEEDGITCTAFKSHAHNLLSWNSDWLVPGYLPEKLTWMLSVLPATIRRTLGPLADVVAGLRLHLKPGPLPLTEAVRRTVFEQWAIRIPESAWEDKSFPPHLIIRFCIRDDNTGKILVTGRELKTVLIQAGIQPDTATNICKPIGKQNDQSGICVYPPQQTITEAEALWPFETIPQSIKCLEAGWNVERYCGLTDNGKYVSIRTYATIQEALVKHALGSARLYEWALKGETKLPIRLKDLSNQGAEYLKALKYPTEQIAQDIFTGAIRDIFINGRPPIYSKATFLTRLEENRTQLTTQQFQTRKIILQTFEDCAKITRNLESNAYSSQTIDSVLTQLAWLVFPGFPRHISHSQLQHYARYFKGITIRLARASVTPSSDKQKETQFSEWWLRYHAAIHNQDGQRHDCVQLNKFRWLLEEYRISLFAQELHTAESVSPKRLQNAYEKIFA